MDQQEIKEVYALAINCIITAVVLALVMLGIHTRNSFAAARNNQTANEVQYQEYVKYKVYDDKDLNGDETITLIREFFDADGIEIYLDRDNNGNSYRVDKMSARKDSSLVDLDTLKSRIDADSTYHVWLVYDFYDIDDFVRLSDESKRSLPTTAGTVTGIVLLRK